MTRDTRRRCGRRLTPVPPRVRSLRTADHRFSRYLTGPPAAEEPDRALGIVETSAKVIATDAHFDVALKES
jgi:hypothetical protein